MTRGKLLSLVTAAAVLSGYAGVKAKDVKWGSVIKGAAKTVSAVKGINEEDEIKIGRAAAAALCGRYGLVREQKSLRYMNLVGKAVARRSKRPELDYRFGILDTDEVNAFAAPGGYVFVTKGLLRSVRDESELAGVLAHEISHVAGKHVIKEIQKSKLIGAGLDFASAVAKNPDVLERAGDLSVDVLMKGLSRKDEYKADKEGVNLAWRVGYDPRSLRRVIERMGRKQAKKVRVFAHIGKTHPPASQRIRKINRQLKSARIIDNPNWPDLKKRFSERLKDLNF